MSCRSLFNISGFLKQYRDTARRTGFLYWFHGLLWIVLAMALLATPLHAQAPMKTEFQYAAKLICSALLPHQDGDLARGIYRTAINIHNPTEEKITFAFKVAVAGGVNDPPSDFGVTAFRPVTLLPDGAVEITCFDALGFFCPTPQGLCIDFAFLNGFAVLKTPVELDVVGVYTARHTDSEVETMDLERVKPRKISSEVGHYMPHDKGEIKQHMPYPHNPGDQYGKQMCGGIAAIPCPDKLMCVDDPGDSCDPGNQGADCPGICVPEVTGGR
jgi:hypothetical protein